MLREKYQKEVVPVLVKKYNLKNKLAAWKVTKVVLNVGLGKVEEKVRKQIAQELAAISGQKPRVCQARKSVAGFGIRAGEPIGLSVTLRGKKMYDFLEKLFAIVLPQVRDFKGLQLKNFDGRGNYTLGLSEQVVFPEIDVSESERTWGLEITIVTNTSDDKKAKELLELLGAPFASEEKNKAKL